ncbi:ImmA/IrrE family metallo-endopeptidase [Planctomicrobium piriforme]|uniref:Zn-dependent peptidase ImmA, M78 family n=1 Tax=Planctomicrobium piriforme TaxID=1576369 RepID=A0A1I3CFD9_9PLAN|nr:ImmA/IrrE family metallo-endopeptidase [Planctomicrobium piriforme]SFH73076.1 Zn-dependent peptidase ImmA, M78 family [Planctomicrobium piriforme]
MPFSSAEIGRRIRDIREQVSFPASSAAEALGISEADFLAIEDGRLNPIPGDYILILSRILEADFRVFISNDLDAVEKETRQVFRALSNPEPSDVMAIRRFVSYCMSEADLESILDQPRPSLPSQYPLPAAFGKLHKTQGRIAAQQERDRLGLGLAPIRNVFRLVRSQGTRVFRHRLADANLSGVTVLHPLAGVCVLINYEEDLYRQFFSTAHEYAHVLFDRDVLQQSGCVVSYKYSKSDLIEMRANCFAAEFLLPAEAINRFSRPKKNDTEDLLRLIKEIAKQYFVNTQTVVLQMQEAGWLTDGTVASFFKNMPATIPRQEKLDPEMPAELTLMQVQRWERAIQSGTSVYYLELLRRAKAEDQISVGRFAEMLGLTVDQAQQFIQEMGLAL